MLAAGGRVFRPLWSLCSRCEYRDCTIRLAASVAPSEGERYKTRHLRGRLTRRTFWRGARWWARCARWLAGAGAGQSRPWVHQNRRCAIGSCCGQFVRAWAATGPLLLAVNGWFDGCSWRQVQAMRNEAEVGCCAAKVSLNVVAQATHAPLLVGSLILVSSSCLQAGCWAGATPPRAALLLACRCMRQLR